MILGIERSLSRLEQQQRNTYALSPHASTRALPLKMADGDYVIGDDVKRTLSIIMMTKIRKSRMSDFSCEKTKVCMELFLWLEKGP